MANEFYDNPEYSNILIQYTGDIEKDVANEPDASIYIIDNEYAILTIKDTEYERIIQKLINVVYIEVDGLYTLTQTTPIDAANAPELKSNPYLNLNGRGVVVGIIDTGIDYLSTEFTREDDTTRILRIWDQTINSKDSPTVTGTEYTEEQINQAIQLSKKEGGDPYSIVPSKDTNGHGTKVATIIGARGKNPQYTGIAQDCQFAIVKLQEADPRFASFYFPYGDTPRYRGSDILIAIKYLYDLARSILKPMIICLPFGGNVGAHDGSNVMERYIDKLTQRRGFIFVTSTGNEGNSDTHSSGIFTNVGEVTTLEVFTPPEQTGLFLDIYITRPDKAILSIVSPSGEVVNDINTKTQTNPRLRRPITIKFIYEGTTMEILYNIVNPATGDERILVRASNLKTGIWQFKLRGTYLVNKNFNAWLLQRELLAPGTKFLNSSPKITLTIPGTSQSIITTSYYNQINDSVISESGRGFTRNNMIKPIISSGGINQPTLAPGNIPTTMSGGSVAAAVLTGCCALLLQWGIVDGNDTTMYSLTVQTYLIRGTAKRSGDTYPNTEWGYGMLDILGVFNSLREDSSSLTRGCTEYYINDIFIRLPKEDINSTI